MHIQKEDIKQILRFMPVVTAIGIVVLISSLGYSFVSTFWSVFLESFVKSESLVGFISAFFVALGFCAQFFLIPVIERANKEKLYFLGSIFIILGYFLYSLVPNLFFFILIEIVITLAFILKISSLGIIVKHKSKKKELSKNEGFIYTLSNIAWVIGPLIAGFIAGKLGIRAVFIFASLFVFLSLIIFKFSNIHDKSIRKRLDKNVLKNFFDFFRNSSRLKAYFLGGGVNFWWSLIYIYAPLLIIIEKGLDSIWLGYFFFAVAIPLIFLEYPFGKVASKIGFRRIFFIGFLIPSIFAVLSFIFFSNIFVVLACLALSSIGLAMIEPTTESYFFDTLSGTEEQRFYSPYNTAIDAGHFAGRILPAIFLLFLPFRFIFLVFAIGMFFLSLLSLRIKNIIEQRRK